MLLKQTWVSGSHNNKYVHSFCYADVYLFSFLTGTHKKISQIRNFDSIFLLKKELLAGNGN